MTETLRVPALGYSAAELRHGPRASITPATPVLVLRQNDEVAAVVDDLIRDPDSAGETVFTAGVRRGDAAVDRRRPSDLRPVLMLVPAYLAIAAAARRHGLDPDSSKITRAT